MRYLIYGGGFILMLLIAGVMYLNYGLNLPVADNFSRNGFGSYSEGYKSGKLTQFAIKGVLIKSGEGFLHLGKDSDILEIRTINNTSTLIRNPWAFSVDTRAGNIIQSYQGKNVWTGYNESLFGTIWQDTDISVVNINEVTEETPMCIGKSSSSGWKSSGTYTGRIVKATLDGYVFKTYEIDIHLGGKNFVSLSTDNKDVFNCAVEWLKSGKEVNVKYVQKLFNWSFMNTDYRITDITPTLINE